MTDPVEVGVDLYRLFIAGKVLLPQVATVYEQDNQDMHNSSYQETQAFDRFGYTSPVYGAWRDLRDRIQTLFADTAITLDLSGLALRTIADNYAAVDQAAADVMRQQIAAYEGNPDLPQAPGPIDVELPGEPHETQTGADGEEVPVR